MINAFVCLLSTGERRSLRRLRVVKHIWVKEVFFFLIECAHKLLKRSKNLLIAYYCVRSATFVIAALPNKKYYTRYRCFSYEIFNNFIFVLYVTHGGYVMELELDTYLYFYIIPREMLFLCICKWSLLRRFHSNIVDGTHKNIQ